MKRGQAKRQATLDRALGALVARALQEIYIASCLACCHTAVRLNPLTGKYECDWCRMARSERRQDWMLGRLGRPAKRKAGVAGRLVALLLLLAACSSPRWTVGECLELDLFREHWQQPEIVRIEAVGRAAYVVRRRVDGVWSNTLEYRRDHLDHPSYWKPVVCPTP